MLAMLAVCEAGLAGNIYSPLKIFVYTLKYSRFYLSIFISSMMIETTSITALMMSINLFILPLPHVILVSGSTALLLIKGKARF